MFELLIVVIVVALVFDFINGFHDAANAIATSVSTGVLSVRTAVVMSAIFNFVGALFGTAVAATIAKGIADPHLVSQTAVLSALLGASAWNLITWWYGIPSSSSHALVGGIVGAVIASVGINGVHWDGIVQKIAVPLVLSPIIGFAMAFAFMVAALWVMRRWRTNTVNTTAATLQLVSAAALSFTHGLNDAQKVMGVITMALISFMAVHRIQPMVTEPGLKPTMAVVAAHEAQVQASDLPAFLKEHHALLLPTYTQVAAAPHATTATTAAPVPNRGTALGTAVSTQQKPKPVIPLWVILSCATAMALGTVAGGKKIIKTMGTKIIRITMLQGFAAQTAGTVTIFLASIFGIPVSTTHCITSSVMGAGTAKSLSAVRWGVARSIAIAWVLTLPASAAMAWAAYMVLRWLFGA